MTKERDQDPEATVKMPRPTPPVAEELEDVDPEQTLVREDWESTVIRRVAPHIAEVQSDIEAGEESLRLGKRRAAAVVARIAVQGNES